MPIFSKKLENNLFLTDQPPSRVVKRTFIHSVARVMVEKEQSRLFEEMFGVEYMGHGN